MNPDQPPKTPKEYKSIAQLTEKGLSSDFSSFLSYRMQFDDITRFKSILDKESKAKELFDGIVTALKNTPTYSERYLNNGELKQATEYGVKREDLINPETEPAIKRLDEMALRCRKIGEEITLENYQSFSQELRKLFEEACTLIRGR